MKRTLRERRAVIEALLEERAYAIAELATFLNISPTLTLVTCQVLRRAGVVVELKNSRWALPGSVAAQRIGVHETGKRRARTWQERADARSTPLATPAALYPGTRTIDGVEYEVVFDGRGGTPDWPDGGASSLGGWLHSILQPS
jgi:hypothetical protein